MQLLALTFNPPLIHRGNVNVIRLKTAKPFTTKTQNRAKQLIAKEQYNSPTKNLFVVFVFVFGCIQFSLLLWLWNFLFLLLYFALLYYFLFSHYFALSFDFFSILCGNLFLASGASEREIDFVNDFLIGFQIFFFLIVIDSHKETDETLIETVIQEQSKTQKRLPSEQRNQQNEQMWIETE